MENNFRPVLTIRIFGEDKCFGPGVAVLLRRVRELHSLRAAAMSIGMAYSKAWTILKNAQLSLGFKLLDSTTGGKHGGGATLTPEGEKLLDAYDSYCTRLRAYAQELFGETFDEKFFRKPSFSARLRQKTFVFSAGGVVLRRAALYNGD
mgnify:CR=1 FL=1